MLCTARHDPESAPLKDKAPRGPLVINLRLFLLFSLLVLTVTGCRSSEVFSYGEIVIRSLQFWLISSTMSIPIPITKYV